MGEGSEVRALQGPDSFDPFTPFHKIAEKWGKKAIKDQKLNVWTSTNA